MGRFLTAAPVAAASLGFDRQPLPLIASYSNSASTSASIDCSIFDSDLNLVARTQHSNSTTPPSPSGSELWTDWPGWFSTTSQISTGWQSTSWVKSTSCNQADGHQMLRIANTGAMSARHPGITATLQANFGVIVGPQGYRQPMSLWQSGTTLRQHLRGQPVQTDILTTGLNNATAAQWANSNNSGRSMVGYNRRSNTLVVIEPRDASCNYRAHIWRHPGVQLSGKPGELDRFILQARAGQNGASYSQFDFAWNANGSASYTESQYRMRVIPCDNAQIALVRFVPSTATHMAVLTPSTGAINTASFAIVSATTSYGVDQGDPAGMRHQITWDNQWVAAFAPYYYYGCGMVGHVVNTSDPSRQFRISYTGTTCGVGLVPIRESAFAWNSSHVNADSAAGLNLGLLDFSTDSHQWSGTNAIGSVLSMQMWGGFIDTGSSSTNYPAVMPVENWSR